MAAAPAFAVFKYDHPGRLKVGLVRKGVVASLAIVAVLAGLLFGPPLFFVLLVVTVVVGAVLWPKSRIVIGPRYLLCGNTIVFWRNVRSVKLVPGKQLAIQSDGQALTIERDRFPTGAKKKPKIEANTRAKFDKVAARVIRHVVQLAPEAQLRGIDRSAYLRDEAEDQKGGRK